MLSVTPFTNNMKNKLAKQLADVKALKFEALDEFKALTPIRSGNARRHTYLQGNAIEANYPYAEKLDEGYSKQAPRGMVEPFRKWLSKRFAQIIKKG